MPNPQTQIQFLERIQRILSEGTFTATYKFALLHALADLCIERAPSNPNAPLTLPITAITDRFVDLYHRQARPYPGRGKARVLQQNTGNQAAVVNALAEPARKYKTAIDPRALPALTLRKINETIRDQPLWKLQTLAGGERLDFLYENTDVTTVREITLRPGIAYCFRAFHPFIVSMVRDRWERWIRRHNSDLFDEKTDLQAFLFGSDRQNLVGYREALLEVHGPTCFYRDTRLITAFDVDHFVPWSRYPVDLGHNFVLASRQANTKKKDRLPGRRFLERWLQGCIDCHAELEAAFERRNLRHDLSASFAIFEWVYDGTEKTGGMVWEGGADLVRLDPGWRDRLRQARQQLGLN